MNTHLSRRAALGTLLRSIVPHCVSPLAGQVTKWFSWMNEEYAAVTSIQRKVNGADIVFAYK